MQRNRLLTRWQIFVYLYFFLALLLAGEYINTAQAQAEDGARPAGTIPPAPLEPLGYVMSTPWGVAALGDLTAAITDGDLVLVDTHDPAFPRMVGRLPLPVDRSVEERQGIHLSDVALVGDFAYVTWQRCPFLCEESGLQVVDVAVPAAPVVVGRWQTEAQVRSVTAVGNLLYLSIGGELGFIDVSDPARPVLLGTFAPTGPSATVREVVVYAGDSGQMHAFVVSDNGRLYVVDVTDPTVPAQVAAYEPRDPCMSDLALVERDQALYAYLADCYAGVRVLDVTLPAQPSELKTHSFGQLGSAHQVAAQGQQLLVATSTASGETTIRSLNLASPTDLTETGVFTNVTVVYELAVTDELLVIADHHQGVQFLDLSGPAQLVEIGRQESVVAYGDMAIDGHTLYLVDFSGLTVIDVFNPVLPRTVAHFAMPHALSVNVDQIYAVVTDWVGGLWVFDVGDPAHPQPISQIEIVTPPTADVALVGTLGAEAYAFVGSQGCNLYTCPPSLQVVDLSDLHQPQVRDIFSDGRGITSMAATATQLYLTTGNFGALTSDFLILDIADPTQPITLSQTTLDTVARDIVVSGGYAYIATPADLCIFDVSNPVAPRLAYSQPMANGLASMAVSAGLLYATDWIRLAVLDLADPVRPTLVDTQPLPVENVRIVSIDTVLVEGGLVYVLNNGLTTWRHTQNTRGQVRDAWGQPQAGVTITASPKETAAAGRAQAAAVSGLTGRYAFTEELMGAYTLHGHLAGYRVWPPARTVNWDSATRAQDFYLVAQPVSTTVQPGVAATLSYIDTRGLDTMLAFPPAALSQASTVHLVPTIATDYGGQRFTGNAFELRLGDGAATSDRNVFAAPVRVTIHYSGWGANTSLDEASLRLLVDVNGVWVEAASFCPTPESTTHDPVHNRVTVTVCTTGRFALFGQANALYLPLVAR